MAGFRERNLESVLIHSTPAMSIGVQAKEKPPSTALRASGGFHENKMMVMELPAYVKPLLTRE
jgi:hypothetical protein